MAEHQPHHLGWYDEQNQRLFGDLGDVERGADTVGDQRIGQILGIAVPNVDVFGDIFFVTKCDDIEAAFAKDNGERGAPAS